jgi:tetratricopeptide (TPR) repeat protein
MTETLPLRDRYVGLIDEIVQMTLKGKIRSKEQVYQMLVKAIEAGTGEVFEHCLGDQLVATQRQIEIQTDEFKLAKANRILRALQTIQGEWQRWQAQNQSDEVIAIALEQIILADSASRLSAFLRSIDPNHPHSLNLDELNLAWRSLARFANRRAEAEHKVELLKISEGIDWGLQSWEQVQEYLVSWIYDQSREQIGFSGTPEQQGPWALWAKHSIHPLPQALFKTLSLGRSPADFAASCGAIDLNTWVELAILLQFLQRGLVSWFDKLVYDSKVGSKLSISAFLEFAILWSQLANGFDRATLLTTQQRSRYSHGAFQVTIQILRTFAQREYFPLYGGVFASFSPAHTREALLYLDEPLRQVEGTQGKARILTLLAFSLRVHGQYDRANQLHQEALEIARTGNDRVCETANLNHLSRNCAAQKHYAEAVNYSQRALILSRQVGDRLGEANALVNVGYSEVLLAQQRESGDPDVYESAINYLQQGLKLAERLGDRQSQALCFSSLGIAHILLDQPQAAIAYLESCIQAAQFSGDLYLKGLSLAYLAEAYYRLQDSPKALWTGALGMYLLEQISAREWRQAAGLLTILQGQMGEAPFQDVLQKNRSQIIAVIGVDGYDHLPELLRKYRHDGMMG